MHGAHLDIDTDVDWDRTAFGLICPDALVRHLGGPILRRLEEHGFRPLAWKSFWHRPQNLDAYYERNITEVWRAYLYRLADRVFEFGPAVALLVHDDAPLDGIGSHQRLRAVKGSSEPAKAAPGTIRGDFGSINVTLGLMHSADSAAESRRETEVFVGTDGFAAGQDPAELHAMIGVLESIRPAEQRDYDDVLGGLRARIVAVLWDELPPAARELADKLQSGGAAAFAATGAGAQVAEQLPEDHLLAPVLRCEFIHGQPGMDTARVAALLSAYGTGLDPWEDLVLATSMRFQPRRRCQGHGWAGPLST